MLWRLKLRFLTLSSSSSTRRKTPSRSRSCLLSMSSSKNATPQSEFSANAKLLKGFCLIWWWVCRSWNPQQTPSRWKDFALFGGEFGRSYEHPVFAMGAASSLQNGLAAPIVSNRVDLWALVIMKGFVVWKVFTMHYDAFIVMHSCICLKDNSNMHSYPVLCKLDWCVILNHNQGIRF